MRRLRLLHDERRSRKVGHEVGSFVRSLEAVSSLTEALIGDKVIYESNTRTDTRVHFYPRIGSHRPDASRQRKSASDIPLRVRFAQRHAFTNMRNVIVHTI